MVYWYHIAEAYTLIVGPLPGAAVRTILSYVTGEAWVIKASQRHAMTACYVIPTAGIHRFLLLTNAYILGEIILLELHYFPSRYQYST